MLSVKKRDWVTHEDEGGIEIFVIFLGVLSVELFGFPSIYGEEVGAGVVCSQRIEELFEGGMETVA